MRFLLWPLVAAWCGCRAIAGNDPAQKTDRREDRPSALIHPGEGIGPVNLGTPLPEMSRIGTSVSSDAAMGRVSETRLIPTGPHEKAEVLIYYRRFDRNADGDKNQVANVIVTYSPDFILYPLTRADGTVTADEDPIRVKSSLEKVWKNFSKNFHHLRYVTSQVDGTQKEVDFYDDPDWGVGFHVDRQSGLIVGIYIFPPLAGQH